MGNVFSGRGKEANSQSLVDGPLDGKSFSVYILVHIVTVLYTIQNRLFLQIVVSVYVRHCVV